MSSNDDQIWFFLKSKDLNDYACAGIIGNLFCESGNRPNNLQNSYEKILGMDDVTYTAKVNSGEYANFVHDSAGYGLAQWTYWSRKQGLLDFIKKRGVSIDDLFGQLDWLWCEMTANTTLINELRSCQSVYEATKIFMCEFERPADQSESAIQRRASYSQQFYNKYAGSKPQEDDTDMGVTYSNSPLATDHVDLNKNSNPRNATYKEGCYNPTGVINKIALHHMAGVMSARQCAEMHKKSSGASANYYVGKDGEICLGVDESRRAWTTGSRECDSYAVTIECSNSQNGEPWLVSDKSYNATVRLIADICKRNGIKRVNFTGDKSGNLVMHKWYQATACPGTYLSGKFGDIANKVNEILGANPQPQPTPQPDDGTVTLYCVQVGAFANKANADRLCAELESKGYKPFVVEKQVQK
jgi:N-acetyl-anhydromuramyl-L-alanine amidase AmpD